MLTITIREFSRNMKDVSDRVSKGEGFLVTKNSNVIFEIKPTLKEECKNLPIQVDKQIIIQSLQTEIQKKLDEIMVLNQHINKLINNK